MTSARKRSRNPRPSRCDKGNASRLVWGQLVTAAFLLLALSFPAGCPAQEDLIHRAAPTPSADLKIEQVQVGLQGHFKVGCLTPISVFFTGESSESLQLAVWAPDPDGNLTRQPSEPVSLRGSGPHTINSVFQTGRMDGVLRVDLEANGRILATKTVRASAEASDSVVPLRPPNPLDVEYWVTLGAGESYERAAEEINREASDDDQRGSKSVVVIAVDDAADLPTMPGGLDSVDVLTINGAQPISDAADAAIRRWVERGGHLVLTISTVEQWEEMPLSEWVPIYDVGTSRLRDLDGLRGQFARSAVFAPGTVSALQFRFDAGRTIARSLDGPLWVQMPYRFGRITLLGLDLTKRPLTTWDSLPELCQRLADYQQELGSQRRSQQATQLSRTGISDLSTQLATAVDQFSEVAGPASWTPMGLIILYLLIVGPLDYLIVHRLLRRPHLTWLTFPVIVAGSAALAASSAFENHPSSLVSRQVSLVDLDAESGAMRTKLWSSFVSPETDRYGISTSFRDWWQSSQSTEDVTMATSGADSATHLEWTGMPETGFRGMYRSAGLDLAKPRYGFAPGLTAIEDAPVSIWSSFGSTATHWGQVSDPSRLVGSDLQGAGGQLSGTVTNKLPLPIDDWFVVHGNLVYFPRQTGEQVESIPLRPDQPVSLRASHMAVRTAKSYLTGVTNYRVRRGKGETNVSDAATRDAYDPLGQDFGRIFRALTFYRESGGKEFTTLDNNALDDLDLSPFIDLSRAVLFGRVDAAPAQLIIDGEAVEPAESETFVRVLLPVRTRK